MFAFLDRLVDKGYVKAWFSWVEWVTLTAAIWVGAKAWDSSLLYVIGSISTVLVWWAACRAVVLCLGGFLANLKWNSLLKKAIAGILGAATPTIVFIGLANLLTGVLLS
ncbi:hypothetical protein [Vibrio atypicus]|uniref:hypothetical protein n=1 Tax=Vibrio atypicus TaxID=558271 RepID=UPI0037356BB7